MYYAKIKPKSAVKNQMKQKNKNQKMRSDCLQAIAF